MWERVRNKLCSEKESGGWSGKGVFQTTDQLMEWTGSGKSGEKKRWFCRKDEEDF